MKKLYYIAAAALLLASCNDWLDVKPRGKMPESEVFKSELGFQSTLMGVYTQMASTKLYGENTTMWLPEYVAQHWSLLNSGAVDAGKDLAGFVYNNHAEGSLAEIWLNYYHAIAQVNKVIQNIEDTDTSFKGDHKRTIYGEALGLRAFLHLDLLRFWGPVPALATDNTQALPYLTKTTRQISDLRSVSWKDYTDALWVDLKKSAELLSDVDPIFHYDQDEVAPNDSGNEGKTFATDTWEQLRKRRFNYYAAVATAARLHAWQGNIAAAADSAMVVINAKDYKDNTLFNLTTDASYTASSLINYSMNTEHIFGVHNPDLQKNILERYEGTKLTATNMTTPKPPVYGQVKSALDSEQGLNPSVNPDDLRRLSAYWNVYEDASVSDKLYGYKKYLSGMNGASVVPATNRIPLLRLAEMYFYVFEGKSVTDAEVNVLIQNFCSARRISQRLYDPAVMDDANKMPFLEREWRKDFYGEGQMMFFYKRLGYTTLTWPAVRTVTSNNWVILKPDNQLVFDIEPR